MRIGLLVAVSLFLSACTDRSSSTRSIGSRELADIARLEKLRQELETGDPERRMRAATELGVARDLGAVAKLIECLLSDKVVLVRASAAWALGRYGRPDMLAHIAGGKYYRDREYPLLPVPEGIRSKIVQGLVSALEDESAEVRREAVLSLAFMQTRDRVSDILRLLKDSDHEVRARAAQAVSVIYPDPTPEVLAALRDAQDPRKESDFVTRSTAARLLQDMESSLHRGNGRGKRPGSR